LPNAMGCGGTFWISPGKRVVPPGLGRVHGSRSFAGLLRARAPLM
jgi:hypothetical protein